MGNLSQKRRAEMLEYLNHLKEIHTDDESRIALGKIETALTEKKYGLVWEEHEEEVDKKLVHNIPVFREVEERRIVADKNADFNFLIEGDNLHSLKLLEKTHKGKIDVIYIDPPYNTGTKEENFKYDDTRIDRNDGYRHSKWLSFMNERLVIAKELLSDDGVLFISIDDNEQAQLKLLCDEIFGGNYVETNIWSLIDSSESTFQKTAGYTTRKEHEYILTIRKNLKFKFNKYNDFIDFKEDSFSNPDNDPRGDWFSGNISRTSIKSKTGSKYYTINTPTGASYSRNWTLSKEEYNIALSENRIYFPKNGDGVPRYKIFKTDKKETIQSSIISGVKTSITGKNEVKNILGYEAFKFPKPTDLIKRLIKISSNNKSIILDFFAGSGTTGQAVMDLNKEDGGSRKFILCTNNENNICEDITYERLSRVIKGYDFEGNIKDDLKSYNLNISNLKKMDSIFQEFEEIKSEKKEEYDKFSNQSKDGVLKLIGEKEISDKVAGIPHNLKYYKTEFIPKLSEDEEILSSKLLDYIKEMVELENMCEIDGVKRRIILSDEDLNIALSEMEECGVLYIPSFILLTNEIKESIEERKLEVVTIPDYYFTEELREVHEL